jgi:hypothetical protein
MHYDYHIASQTIVMSVTTFKTVVIIYKSEMYIDFVL